MRWNAPSSRYIVKMRTTIAAAASSMMILLPSTRPVASVSGTVWKPYGIPPVAKPASARPSRPRSVRSRSSSTYHSAIMLLNA